MFKLTILSDFSLDINKSDCINKTVKTLYQELGDTYIMNALENDEECYDCCVIQDEIFWLVSPIVEHRDKQKLSRLYQEFLSSETVCLNPVDRKKDAVILAHAKLVDHNKKFANLQTKLLYSLNESVLKFPNCHEPIGLYPIISDYEWLEKIIHTGIKTIQLRIKMAEPEVLEENISRSVQLAQQVGVKLFINDHWNLAIKHGAYGVHLGQGDLKSASLQKISDSGIRLGISTHCHHELSRAKTLNPSYVAIGAIFATNTKPLDFTPQGVDRLKMWAAETNLPVVAIGGINLSNLPIVCSAKPAGISVISALTQNSNPTEEITKFLRIMEQHGVGNL